MEKDTRKLNIEASVVITSADRIDGQEMITMRPQDVLEIPTEALYLSDLGRTSYVAVGHCIYCSETDNLKVSYLDNLSLISYIEISRILNQKNNE